MTSLLAKPLAGLAVLTAAAAAAHAQSLVFSEDFGTIANGTALTPTLTSFNYTTSYGTREVVNPAGTNAALKLTSATAGNVVAGFGVGGLAAGDVFSVSFDLNIIQMPGGTSIRFTMGQGGGTMFPAQGANPPRIDGNANDQAWVDQSLFAVRMGGNGTLGSEFGLLSSLNTSAVWSQVDNTVIFSPGATHTLHFVANGGATDLTLGANLIGAGRLGVYVDNTFVASVVMTDRVSADTFMVYSHGRSANGDFASGTLDNFKIWNGAVAPDLTSIPEPSAFAALGGLSALVLAAGRRRRRA